MSVLQQASKDALSRLKSELESEKETLKKERNSHGVERLLEANQKGRERERLQKERNEPDALQIEHVRQKRQLRYEKDKLRKKRKRGAEVRGGRRA